jgi:hypothetical protein
LLPSLRRRLGSLLRGEWGREDEKGKREGRARNRRFSFEIYRHAPDACYYESIRVSTSGDHLHLDVNRFDLPARRIAIRTHLRRSLRVGR